MSDSTPGSPSNSSPGSPSALPSQATPGQLAVTPMDRECFAQGAAFIDGHYVPIAEARLPLLDWGFLHSDVTYDVAHVWQGQFFRLEDHLERFEQSAAGLRLRIPYGRSAVTEIMMECVRLTRLREAYVEIICTRGFPPVGSRDPRTAENRFYAFAVPFIWIATEAQRKRGLHLRISNIQRIPPTSVNPVQKNFHWGDFTRGLFDAYDHGDETVVLVDGQGNLTEGPGFNIFLVRAGQVYTPDRGMLEGITRRTVMELCAELGLPLAVASIPATAAAMADEVFLSSTAGGVIPITRVNGEPVAKGSPGQITQQLAKLYWNKQEAGWHGTPVVYD